MQYTGKDPRGRAMTLNTSLGASAGDGSSEISYAIARSKQSNKDEDEQLEQDRRDQVSQKEKGKATTGPQNAAEKNSSTFIGSKALNPGVDGFVAVPIGFPANHTVGHKAAGLREISSMVGGVDNGLSIDGNDTELPEESKSNDMESLDSDRDGQDKRPRRPESDRQQHRLLLLRHASKCSANGECKDAPHCAAIKGLLRHIADCDNQQCHVSHCVSSRFVLSHYHRCVDVSCNVCAPARDVITKSHQRQLAEIRRRKAFTEDRSIQARYSEADEILRKAIQMYQTIPGANAFRWLLDRARFLEPQAFHTPGETGTEKNADTSVIRARDTPTRSSGVNRGSRHADETLPETDKITGLTKTAGRSKDSNGIGLIDVATNAADCLGLARALADAAKSLAENSGVPGVSAAASVVQMLVNMAMDHKANPDLMRSVNWCSCVVAMLQRAEDALRKEELGEHSSFLLDEVKASVNKTAELLTSYESKGRLWRLITSSLFKKRLGEAENAIQQTLMNLQFGVCLAGNGGRNNPEQPHRSSKCCESGTHSRLQRRQRRLDDLEIDQDYVEVTDDKLGNGGFSTVYLCDFNGQNAAAKLIPIFGGFSELDEDEFMLDTEQRKAEERAKEQSRRRGFLRELEAMVRLRSPHVVQVFGAITSDPETYILVMELAHGGDLAAMLRAAEERLPLERARLIIGDICAGIVYLHSKRTVHGDIKSANILLDRNGRAKISDFGAARWAQQGTATCLATYTAGHDRPNAMSYRWAAPEVFRHGSRCNSYASDVYSFGIVVWEVITRKLPWADVPDRDLYRRVVMVKNRPEMPSDAPPSLAKVAQECWAHPNQKRPKIRAIMEQLKNDGWEELR